MKKDSGRAPDRPNTIRWPESFLTALIGLVAFGLIASAIFSAKTGDGTLPMLSKRAEMLSEVTDPIKRDSLCVPLSAYGRALDKALDKNARVYFSGLVGKTNAGKAGYYCFLQNYLFPREVAWSLGTNAVFHCDYFEGTDSDSPSVVQTNGFDLMIRASEAGIQLIPLTQKGVPHE